jgi:hypothetical protein
MLPEYYDRFKTEYNELVEALIAQFNTMCGGAVVAMPEDSDTCKTSYDKTEPTLSPSVNNDAIASFQQVIIDSCTELESSWLTVPNVITHSFEDICELLFKFTEGDQDALSQVGEMLDSMKGLFEQCYDRQGCRLAIALMERNEGRYLKEWLEYHLLMGAEHFYVYDHGSTDDSLEVLAPYAEQGMVEIIPVEGEYLPTQIAVYNDALVRARYSAEYLAFIDTDEFLTPMKHERAIDAIDDIFTTYENNPFKSPGSCAAGGIGVNWRVYGSSGHQTPADGLVIDEYRYRGPDDLMINAHIKTICKPLCVDKIINPHFAIYKQGYWCISEHGSLIPGAFFYDSKGDILRLNHYYVKSEEEYVTRRLNFKRSEAGRQRLATEEEVKHTNEIYDDCAVRFIPDGTYHQEHP